MLKFIILLIFATSLTMPLQSVDGLSCADGYMPDPNYEYDPDTFSMQSCVPNPDYKPLINVETLQDLLVTIDQTQRTSEESTSILDNPTILILLILVIVILIIMIRNNLGNRNN